MRVKKTALIAFAAAFCVSAAGCSAEEPGLGGLLTAPKMSEEQKQINDALVEAIGDDITLKYPTNGENRSAILIANIDDEDTDEAIVFYKYTDSSLDEGTVRVNILDRDENGDWFSAIDFQGSGAEIDRIFISPLRADSADSLVIGYSTLSANENSFQVYSYSEENLDTVYTDTYSLLTVADLDSDGIYDILKTNSDSETGEETATVLEWEQDGFKTYANIEMSGYTQSYLSCRQGETESGSQAIFIDALKTDGDVKTDIITEGYGTYQNSSTVFKDKVLNKTLRQTGYLTSDVDGDGILEIPTTETMTGYSGEDAEQMTVWSVFKDDFSLSEKYRGYYNLSDGYFFSLPKELLGKVTVKLDEKTGETVFYRLEKTAAESTTELFRINVVNSSEYENYRALGYMLLTDAGQLRYIVKRTGTDDELCLKLDDIKSNFYVVD